MPKNHTHKPHTLSRLVILASISWLCLCAILFSNAGTSVFVFVLTWYIAGAWGAIWFIRLVMTLGRLRKKQATHQCTKSLWLFWLFEPAAIILPLVCAYFGLFSAIRFSLSEQALLNYVENVRTGKVDLAFEFQHPPRQVGLYTVTFTDRLPDGTVRLLTSSHGMLDRAGFAHSPHSPPPKQGEDVYKPIHQPWWYWYESW